MKIRGIRGATTVKKDSKTAIIGATKKLLSQLISQNQLKVDDIAAIIFSATDDLKAEFPAAAAREMGMELTPLLCCREIDVKGSLKKCIRILVLANTDKSQEQVKNVYLNQAVNLRR